MSSRNAYPGAALAEMDEPPRTRRPKLLYLITRAEHGGAQSHVLELASAMRGDYEVSVATGEEGFLTSACREAGIPVFVIPSLEREVRPVADLRALRDLCGLMRAERPDLLHAHTFKAGFLGRLAARLSGVASIYTVHMWPFGSMVPFSWRVTAPFCERLAARCGHRLITVSEMAVQVAKEYSIHPLSRVIAIRNGIPDHPARARLTRSESPLCVMVARFTAFKDHELLLRAFAGIPVRARLCLVGEGETMPAVQRLAGELNIADRVEFLGARNDVPQILEQADVFVLASKIETLPISILEAMRAGLPVVASSVGGVAEEVAAELTGLLAEPGSVDSLRAALTRLICDRNLRISMGRAGRIRFEKEFLAERMVRQTEAVYREVLAERHV